MSQMALSLSTRSMPDLSELQEEIYLDSQDSDSRPDFEHRKSQYSSNSSEEPATPTEQTMKFDAGTPKIKGFPVEEPSIHFQKKEEFRRDISTTPEPPPEPDEHPKFHIHHPDHTTSNVSIQSAPAEFDIIDNKEKEANTTLSKDSKSKFNFSFSLYDYLQEEVLAVEMDGELGLKNERVTNFLTVPQELEKIIIFGFIVCFDSFLYNFTILPIRFMIALYYLFNNTISNVLYDSKEKSKHLRLSHKCDLAKGVIVLVTLVLLHHLTDASKMYHIVKGQETIKIYVIFNVLEIADRLCCSLEQDLQDSLFSREAFGRRSDGSHPHLRPLLLMALNIGSILGHTMVLFYQLVSLNVTVNSASNALLTLLLSNQFVEIKGSVFKRFEKENLFQITCADVVERFQITLMLALIAFRNLIELSSTAAPSTSSFPVPPWSLIVTILHPCAVMLISECFVDWLKHAFITKFNHIRPGVYGRYIDVLCKDLIGSEKRKNQPFVDQSPLVSRRLGLPSIPLGCLAVRLLVQALNMLGDDSHVDECAFPQTPGLFGKNFYTAGFVSEKRLMSWGLFTMVGLLAWTFLIALKLLIGINLREFATKRWQESSLREKEEKLNDRSRPQIGLTSTEKEQNEAISQLLASEILDAAGKTKVSLTTLSRYEMVKSRIW